MKNKFATIKKNANMNTPLGEAAAVGAVSGGVFYLAAFLFSGVIEIGPLLGCCLFGFIGGAFPELIFLLAGNTVPIIRSWVMVVALLLLLPSITTNLYGFAFIYGYLLYLLNTARKKGLPDT